jgi:hypothetical protein
MKNPQKNTVTPCTLIEFYGCSPETSVNSHQSSRRHISEGYENLIATEKPNFMLVSVVVLSTCQLRFEKCHRTDISRFFIQLLLQFINEFGQYPCTTATY